MRKWFTIHHAGHIGVSLTIASPIAFIVSLTDPLLALVFLVWTVANGLVPDLDSYTNLIKHRGVTHTVAFAFYASIYGALAGFPFGQMASVVLALGAFLGIVSHLLADVLNPMGVALWWPLSDRRYTLNVCLASDTAMNRDLLATGIATTALTATLAVWMALP